MAIEGIIVPTPTPMDTRGESVELTAVQALVDDVIAGGAHGMFVNGTTGEGAMLTVGEREQLAAAFLEASGDRLPVILQVGGTTTQESVRLARHAADIGVAAVAIVAPYYFAHDQAALERHAEEVALAASPVPAYLYDIPSRTGNGYGLEVARRLIERGVVIGAKDSSGDLPKLLELLSIPGFRLLPGADHLALVSVQAGAAGIVSGPAAVVPQPFVRMWNSFRQGDLATAASSHAIAVKVSRLLRYGADIPLLKAMLRQRLDSLGAPRPPHSAPPVEELNRVRAGLERVLQEARFAVHEGVLGRAPSSAAEGLSGAGEGRR